MIERLRDSIPLSAQAYRNLKKRSEAWLSSAEGYRSLKSLSDYMASKDMTEIFGNPLAQMNEKLDKLIVKAEEAEKAKGEKK
jgi:hypothetical protein